MASKKIRDYPEKDYCIRKGQFYVTGIIFFGSVTMSNSQVKNENTANPEKLAPVNDSGARSDTRYSKKLSREHAAIILYKQSSERLLNVNSWKNFAGKGADFQLCDKSGYPLSGNASENDLIKIHLPFAKKLRYEWVEIESILSSSHNNTRSTVMRVRPTAAPGASAETHFFSSGSTSTFIISLSGSTVTAAVIGRNEQPNIKEVSFFMKIRNFFIATFAMLGFNKPEWKALARGLLGDK